MSGLVKVSFCDTVTGLPVGYGLVRYQDLVDCEGAITSTIVKEYFDLSDVSQGATIPAGWEVCEPSGGSSLSLVDVDGTALTSGDNVLRGMVFEDATPLDTDGLGSQILALDCSLQHTTLGGAERIGVSNRYFRHDSFQLYNYAIGANNYALNTTFNVPSSPVVTLTNPCSNRAMALNWWSYGGLFINCLTPNAQYSFNANHNVSVNGGATIGLGLPAYITNIGLTAGSNTLKYATRTHHLASVLVPAGGTITFQAITPTVTVIGKAGAGTVSGNSSQEIIYFWRMA